MIARTQITNSLSRYIDGWIWVNPRNQWVLSLQETDLDYNAEKEDEIDEAFEPPASAKLPQILRHG